VVRISASNVAQDVHPAKLAVHRGEHPVDVIGVGHVTGDRECLAAELPDAVRRCLYASLVAVEQHEVGAGLGERRRHGAAHTLRASGNDGDPAGQIK